MADTKISDLAAVTDVQDTDEFVLARAGATKKIDGVDLRAELAGGGSGESLQRDISQTSHGLAVGDVVRHNGTNYVKAQADSAVNAEVVGIVAAVAGANSFTLHFGGHLTGLSGLTAGSVYFLDDDTAGLLTTTEPPDAGDVSKPLLLADTTTSGYFFDWRGAILGTGGVSGAGFPHPRKTGSYYSLLGSTADATMVLVLNTCIYMPYPVYMSHTIDRISLGVSGAGGAGSVVRLGIYNSDANGQPSSLLLDAGTINGTSATFQEITISQSLAGGTLYWAAICSQVGTAATVRAIGAGNGSEWVAFDTNARDPRTANYQQTGVTGAFGTATPALGSVTNPAVKVRIA